jgi:hypothetical protein
LNIRRGVWRGIVSETKTEDSAATVPVIEPLRSLLARLRAQTPDGFLIQNATGKPLGLDSLNVRVIAPATKKAGIEWRGYYPGRRGISGKATDTSKNALNSTGLLRHSTPITALKREVTMLMLYFQNCPFSRNSIICGRGQILRGVKDCCCGVRARSFFVVLTQLRLQTLQSSDPLP